MQEANSISAGNHTPLSLPVIAASHSRTSRSAAPFVCFTSDCVGMLRILVAQPVRAPVRISRMTQSAALERRDMTARDQHFRCHAGKAFSGEDFHVATGESGPWAW